MQRKKKEEKTGSFDVALYVLSNAVRHILGASGIVNIVLDTKQHFTSTKNRCFCSQNPFLSHIAIARRSAST